MAKFVNSFALLDDEEEDDVEVLVNRIVKKVDNSLTHAKNDAESFEFARNGRGGRIGGQSHRDVSHENGNGWDDDVQGGNGVEWNHSKNSYGIGDGSSLDQGKGVSGENGWGDVNEAVGDGKIRTATDDAGWLEVSKNHSKNSYGIGDGNSFDQGKGVSGENGWGDVNEAVGDGKIQTATDDAGWLEVSKNHSKNYANNNRPFGDDYGNKNGNRNNDVEKRGYGDQVQHNGAADRQRQYRNGNQSYGGERRGYENQGQDKNASDGRRQFRNGRRGYDGERRVYEDKAQNNTASSEQQSRKVDVNENYRAGGEERKYRSGNRNFGGEKRGYGGNRERGRQEYRRTGNGEVKENVNADDGHVNGFGGDAEMVLEASKTAETEQQNTSEEVSKDTRLPKEDTEEQKKKTELELKQKEEEMKEAALMTLDQYEKLLSEKKQALNSQKTELRKVSIDKELEGMRLIEKKPVASDVIRKSAKDKPKKKNSPKNQALETSKTEDNTEVTESDANLQYEEEKLEKDGGLEKKLVEVRDIFKPASHRSSFGGRGQGRGGRGEQGGFRDRTNNDGPRTNRDAAARTPARPPAFRCPRIPTDRDFPVLSANLPAPVKSSTQ